MAGRAVVGALLFIGALLLAGATARAQTVLVPFGATWRYLDDGSAAAAGWQDPGFDDAAWAAGPAPLGYGRGDEATLLSDGAPGAPPVTTWLRHTFAASGVAGAGPLTLSAERDDGALFYLNGTEVARSQLPAGPIDFATPASDEAAFDDERVHRFCVPASLLVEGENVLAVELHRAEPGGGDVRLDASLVDAPPSLERPPYLQQGGHDRMVVRWRTDTCADTRLRWGTAPDDLVNASLLPSPSIEHEVLLSGLASLTEYFYEVGTSTEALAGGDDDHAFTTAPAPGTRRRTRIWAVGDSGGCGAPAAASCVRTKAVQDAYAGWSAGERTDLLLMLGDNAYPSGTDRNHTDAVFQGFAPVLRATPLWPAPGNHDLYGGQSAAGSGAYYDAFSPPTGGEVGGLASGTEAYYSFDHANVHFISLDSYDTDLSAPADPVGDVCTPGQGGLMYQWLCADLAATDQEFVIAYWHHPPYSKGSHDSDGNGAGGPGCSRMCRMRQGFVAALEHHGVDLVLTGHSHSYERSHLIDGHYGDSDTYDGLLHAMDPGDGDPAGDGAYWKSALAKVAHEGAVYAVVGSSSQVTAEGTYDHPVMTRVELELGSLAVEVAGRVLDAWFVDDAGAVLDRFRIVKGDPLPACDDGVDNDGDGLFDAAEDPGCGSPVWQTESPACNDGVDNDGDGGIDYDGSPPDSYCAEPWRNRESARACGLGFEGVLIAALLARLGRRRGARASRR